jgi:hypothetical protein
MAIARADRAVAGTTIFSISGKWRGPIASLQEESRGAGSMDGTDRMLVLILRNHDLLRVAAEMRRRALRVAVETDRRKRLAQEAAARAREAAEHAREVAERAIMLIVVRRAVLRGVTQPNRNSRDRLFTWWAIRGTKRARLH